MYIYIYIYIYKYTNLPVNATVRLPHPRSGDSQGQETFLAPSADKQTRNYDTECSNHHIYIYQASAYEAWDRTRTPLHTPKTLETCKRKLVLLD